MPSSDTPLNIPPYIAKLTGPLLLGHLLNWCLFGALSIQSYIYYLSFPTDKSLLKSIVIFIYSLELLQVILATRGSFRDFGTGWGNMTELNAVGWLWFSVPVLGSIISYTAQIFFAWRIWIPGHGKLLVLGTIVSLSVVQCVTGIWSGIYAYIINDFRYVQEHTNKTTAVWLGGTALCDVIIAIFMIYYLSISHTGFRSTTVILSKLIRVTIETGLVCATFAILDLASFLAYEENNYYLAPSILLSKLYSNSLLVVLNSRVRIIGGRDTEMYRDDATLGSLVCTEVARGAASGQRTTGGNSNWCGFNVNVPVTQETRTDRTMPFIFQWFSMSQPRPMNQSVQKSPEFIDCAQA